MRKRLHVKTFCNREGGAREAPAKKTFARTAQEWAGKPTSRVFTQVSLYATSPGLPPLRDFERQGMPTCRFQDIGSREFVAIHAPSLCGWALEGARVARKDGDTYKGFLGEAVEAISADSIAGFAAMKIFRGEAGKIFRGVLREGQFSYMPYGWFIVERTLGDAISYGIRTAAFDTGIAGVRALKDMVTHSTGFARPHGSEDVLVKFSMAAGGCEV